MKLTTVTHVSVDGVMQGLGGPDEDRRGGFERGGWALPLFENDNEAAAFVSQVYQRADAFLFGRRTYEIFAGSWGVRRRCVGARTGPGPRGLHVVRRVQRPRRQPVAAARTPWPARYARPLTGHRLLLRLELT
jgi:dihydrofolate reductase